MTAIVQVSSSNTRLTHIHDKKYFENTQGFEIRGGKTYWRDVFKMGGGGGKMVGWGCQRNYRDRSYW